VKRRSFILAVILVTLSGCNDKSTTFRYRLTMEVETPDGLRTGSSVIEVRVDQLGPNSIPNRNGADVIATGEAVSVDLPNRKTIYALLVSENNRSWAEWVMISITPAFSAKYNGRLAPRLEDMLNNRNKIVVPRYFPRQHPSQPKNVNFYPMFVTFDNQRDPSSVRMINPDDFSATLGKGIILKHLTVQLTDAPISEGITRRLPWLLTHRGKLAPGPGRGIPSSDPAKNVNSRAFIRTMK
jgi:hypothetical protein